MVASWIRSLMRTSFQSRSRSAAKAPRTFRPELQMLERREVPATGFLFSGLSSAVAGMAANVSVTAVNADGTTDAAYTGLVHFTSSDTRAVLPADASLVNGIGSFPVTFLTAGTQSLIATDTQNSAITGSLGTGTQAGPGFSQTPSAAGGLVLSSWCDPNGSDADMYAYDNFTLNSNQAINEIDWRGGYLYGAPYGKAWNFTITFFDSILGGSQPLVTNPQLPETYLAQYQVGGNAGETYVGTVGGIAMYDYQFVLPSAFQAVGGHTYWLRIEASQVGYPDWGVAASTSGNNQHFQFSTGAAHFSYGGGDEAFSLKTTETAGVVVSSAATSQLVVNGLASPVTAGSPSEFAVTAEDAYGNVTPGYTGTVRFSSSDFQAALPADYFFSSTDQGRQTFIATLKTAGDQWLSATDLFNGSIVGGQAIATVTPAAAAGLTLAGIPASTTAGAALPFTVAVVDSFGNVAANYAGAIHFSSSDVLASLPSDYSFTPGDAGIHAFYATFNTLGTQTLTAADTLNTAINGSVFTAGHAAMFDFDTGTPALHPTMGLPSLQTANGVTAYFSSPNAWLSQGFSVQSHDTTFFNLSQFSGNYLYPNSVYNPNLAISFSQPVSSITFTYATADFGQNETPTTVQVTAYLGSTVVGSASSHGVFYMGDTMPQGTLTFNGAGQTFDHVLIEIPPQPLAASDMLVDNIVVTTPDVAGVFVNPPVAAPVTPSLVVNNDVFTYDSLAHSATATALGSDGVTQVVGSFTFTYNGSPTAPTNAGVYTVAATFTSADPNYTNATGTASLTINPALPSVTVNGGTFTYDATTHAASATALAVDGVTPVAGNFSFTYNGSTTAPTNAGVYTVAATFTSADPNYTNATSTASFTINPALPSMTVNGGTFTYDATAHAASATALGVDGVTPVAGSISFTYNGSTSAPTNAGVYTVVATFTSADSNYASATASSTLTIAAATPVFSSLSSPTISAGTATTTLSGHLAAGSVFPTGSMVAITLNGLTQNAVVDAGGNFSTSFATGALPMGNYTITYVFAGDGANFLAAPTGSSSLTISAVAPQITIQPQSQTVVKGASVTFTAAASGNPAPSVQWQVSTDKGKTWTNISGATSTTLTFLADPKQSRHWYRAVFTNSAGTAITQAVVLTVKRK